MATAQPGWPAREPTADTVLTHSIPEEVLNNAVPLIIYRKNPSRLLFVDGEPSVMVDETLRMYRVINTPELIIKNHHDQKYYLYAGTYWYVADSATCCYQPVKECPEVIKLIDGLVKAADKKLLKGKPSAMMSLSRKTALPEIVVSTEPAELIQTAGEPEYLAIPGTSLTYITNSPDDLFRDSASRRFFVLLSGRWYESDSLEGPWVYRAANELPAGFSAISSNHPKAAARVHVAGTDAAEKAVAHARELQITRIKRDTVRLNIRYDGGAEFSSLFNTGIFVSENSNIPIINVRDRYYALQDGIWYRSYDAIGGIWEVSPERPPDIDKIPATHRMYYTRFVYICDTTGGYITTGYTEGYKNTYIQDHTIVWGTGWPYRSWHRRLYFVHPPTWGAGYHYTSSGWEKRPGLPEYRVPD